jgi:hypothetical protein
MRKIKISAAGIGLINSIPLFIASDAERGRRFQDTRQHFRR